MTARSAAQRVRPSGTTPTVEHEPKGAQPVNALDRADQTLARAQARRADVVTPDSATSPMDQTNTVQIPRTLVQAVDPRVTDPDSTMVLPAAADDPRAGTRSDFGPARPRR